MPIQVLSDKEIENSLNLIETVLLTALIANKVQRRVMTVVATADITDASTLSMMASLGDWAIKELDLRGSTRLASESLPQVEDATNRKKIWCKQS